MPNTKEILQKNSEARDRLLSDFDCFNKNGEFNRRKGSYEASDKVREDIYQTLPDFISLIRARRTGNKDENGRSRLIAKDISFNEAVNKYYGAKDYKAFLAAFGIDTNEHSLSNIASKVSGATINDSICKDIFNEYTQYSSTPLNTTSTHNSAFRFIIAEVILQIIRSSYEHTSKHPSWIGGTDFVANRKDITVPYEDGDTMYISSIKEGGSIPSGSFKFGQKKVHTKKYGSGFNITQELLDESSVDMVATALRKVGARINAGEDLRAIQVLLNGEQSDGSESPAVIGVNTIANNFTHRDIDEVVTQMSWLGLDANQVIGNKSDMLIDLNESKPERERITVSQYIDANQTIWPITAGYIIFLNQMAAMRRLQFKSMMVETNYKAENQTHDYYVSFQSGFYITQRDARIILDRTQTFLASNFSNFPFLDINAYLAGSEFDEF